MKNMFIVSIMIISALVLLLTIPQGNAATEQRNTRAADIGKSPGREDENPNPTSSDASNAAATVKKKSFEAEMDQSVINTNAEFSDPVNSVRGKIPDGWTLISAPRWGVSQTTLGFQIKDNPLVTANLYYRIFEKPETKTAEEIKGWLKTEAIAKTEQRVKSGLRTYKSTDGLFRTINDRVAYAWSATYSHRQGPRAEYLVRIYSSKGTFLFFIQAPDKDMVKLIPVFDSMIAGTTIP